MVQLIVPVMMAESDHLGYQPTCQAPSRLQT